MTLFVSHFSTSFWEVLLIPAFHNPTTRIIGLLKPLTVHLLDYLFTTNLADSSWLLHHYSFNPIKYKMLVTPYTPHCLPLRN